MYTVTVKLYWPSYDLCTIHGTNAARYQAGHPSPRCPRQIRCKSLNPLSILTIRLAIEASWPARGLDKSQSAAVSFLRSLGEWMAK